MDYLVKLILSASVPLWSAIAIIGVFSGYFAGLAGIGVMFIIIVVVVVVWNKTITTFVERIYPFEQKSAPPNPYEAKFRELEARLEEVNRKIKE